MTPLYRCPWCVQVERSVMAPARMRKHILEVHRDLLIRGLGLLESFGTHVKELTRSRYPTTRLDTSPGVSGEGDS